MGAGVTMTFVAMPLRGPIAVLPELGYRGSGNFSSPAGLFISFTAVFIDFPLFGQAARTFAGTLGFPEPGKLQAGFFQGDPFRFPAEGFLTHYTIHG